MSLADKTERLNGLLIEAEAAFRRTFEAFGVRGEVALEDGVLLSWSKHTGGWRLWIARSAQDEPKPLIKASRRHRVLSAEALDRLWASVEDSIGANEEQLDAAIDLVDAFVEARRT